MERGPQENFVDMEDYTPPVVPTYGSAPDYGAMGGLEPVAGLDTVPSWEEQPATGGAQPHTNGAAASESITLDFTDSQVDPYASVSGKIGGSSGTVPAVDGGGSSGGDGGRLMPRGLPSSSDPDFGDDPPPSGGGAPAAGAAPSGPADPRSAWFWNPRRYQGYFDVDTADVARRMLNSLKGPLMPRFLDDIRSNPDLYGPFWVATTLIFITAVTGNLANYLSGGEGGASGSKGEYGWVYDIDKVSFSAVLFYGYVGGVGGALWGVLAYCKAPLSLAHVWCTYGYALTVFLPIAPLCTLPVEWLRWLLVLAATAMSGLFLLLNLQGEVREAAGAKGFLMLAAIAGLHLALGLSLKLFFFQF
eukprot:jgi/Tetstr1/464406/TSEL_009199.t1